MANAPLQITDGDRGKAYPTQNELLEEGYCLFLSATNVTRDGFAFDKCQFISEQKDNELRKGRVFRGDVILTTRGTLGNVAYYSDDVPYEHVRINSGMVTIHPTGNDLRSRYLYYFLKSDLFQAQVRSLQSGAAQPQLPIRDIKKIKFAHPDVDAQDRIAELVGTYDDLIQNNRRRIELLEDSARLLYREWFVHFRFPGHEHAKFINGVPEAWTSTTVGAHCPLNYGKALKAETRIPGSCDVYGSSGIVGSHNQKLVDGPAIVVGRKGNVGSTFWAPRDFWPIDTVYYVSPDRSDFFTYYALQNVTFINTDVAVPGLNRDYAHSRKLIVPSKQFLTAFNEQARGMYSQIDVLQRQVAELAKARDLLLTRLMDGRLEV
ncbi:restriction endonuclease subunit S [Brucella pituitosa]|uniref:restriction endonuclease subunit S n=1 Tax=Brucella pituitosa TaxID=571256 RepID=UPI00200455B7|nr:restriction endonuclease subunit S [Brucella pituitosa]MCK4207532.1 restriction endonuclease subunit S [Brucella pituitosa]